TKTVIVQLPTQEQYIHLYEQHSQTLICLCSLIAVPFGKLITQFTSTYHEVCSSQFVHDEWIKYLNSEPQMAWFLNFETTVGLSLDPFQESSCSRDDIQVKGNSEKFLEKFIEKYNILNADSYKKVSIA
ncbi:unnamed protein product, partial [Didymodactylos carnosus]